jgi:hypothetical protein
MRKSVTLYSLSTYTPEKKRPSPSDEMRKGVPPCEWVIQNILNYSKALSVMKSENTGFINMIMN